MNDQRQVVHAQRSEIIAMSLDKNEEMPLMLLDKELEFPLYISVNMLVVTPSKTGLAVKPAHVDTQTVPISNIGSAGGSNRAAAGSNDSDQLNVAAASLS